MVFYNAIAVIRSIPQPGTPGANSRSRVTEFLKFTADIPKVSAASEHKNLLQ
jgi:hypothetical protein